MAKQNKGRKFFAASATAALVASAIVPVASAAQVNDYNKISGYAKEAVQSLVDAGVIQGDTNGNFNPLNTVTRAQAAEIFTKALELEADGDVNFSDVKKGAWYYNSIAAVVANGIFEGVSAKEFAPNKSLTRSEAAKVLVDAFGLEGSESLSQFADASQVKPWAKDALETAVANGIFTGSEENGKLNLKPNAAITRQDFAVVFARTLELVDTEAPVDATVKAINNTTVEVTFDEKVGNLDELKFEIDGLEIKNKAHKQSNDKVVVLTTAAQEVGKEYTVKLDGEEIGKFKGVEAVIPTAVDVVEQSLQAKLGTQVTVKAQVKVEEGKSKAGIPVTFNIVNAQGNQQNPGGSLNQPIIAEAHTDENGVATYTYTRYASTANQLATSDEVQAYATGNATLRSFGKVYWAAIQPLTITEVTEGNTINNGAKKVYKVKVAREHAEYQANSFVIDGKTYAAGSYVNIAYEENLNVTPDKAVKAVDVIDANGTSLSYPGQFTTSLGNQSNVKVVKLLVNSDGEATFTLSGSNGKVTPIVFVDQKENPANASGQYGRFNPTELFAKAPTVDFSKIQNLGLNVTSAGTKDAAAYRNVPTFGQKDAASSSARVFAYRDDAPLATGKSASTKLEEDIANTGGRDYKAVLTDKAGKLAPSGTVVKVSVESGSALKTTGPIYLVDNNRQIVYQLDNSKTTEEFALATDSKGEVSFTLFGNKDSYATPTVFVETGDKTGLDKNDLQQVGEIAYFGDVKISTAKLTVNGKDQNSASVSEAATFSYKTVDQNNKPYFNGTEFNVNFQVDTTFTSATIYDARTNALLGTVNQGSAGSGNFTVRTTNGIASIKAVSTNGNTVSVHATSANLPSLTASATFTKVNTEGIEAGQSVTGKVIAVDKNTNRILLSNSTGSVVYELSYDNSVLYTGAIQLLEGTFETDLSVGDELTFTQATDKDKKVFKNTNVNSGVTLKDNVKLVLSYNDSVYDFANGTIGNAVSKTAAIEVQGNNVTLKNLTLNGNLEVTDKVVNDFTLDTVNVTGTTTVKGGDGNTFNAISSNLGLVFLDIKEHIALTNSTIAELVAKVTGSSVTGTGTITTVTVPTGVTAPSVTGVTAPAATPEVPFTNVVVNTTGDTATFTFAANVQANIASVSGGTVATTTGDTVTVNFAPALVGGQVVTVVSGGKTYTATYTAGSNQLTFTRKY